MDNFQDQAVASGSNDHEADQPEIQDAPQPDAIHQSSLDPDHDQFPDAFLHDPFYSGPYFEFNEPEVGPVSPDRPLMEMPQPDPHPYEPLLYSQQPAMDMANSQQIVENSNDNTSFSGIGSSSVPNLGAFVQELDLPLQQQFFLEQPAPQDGQFGLPQEQFDLQFPQDGQLGGAQQQQQQQHSVYFPQGQSGQGEDGLFVDNEQFEYNSPQYAAAEQHVYGQPLPARQDPPVQQAMTGPAPCAAPITSAAVAAAPATASAPAATTSGPPNQSQPAASNSAAPAPTPAPNPRARPGPRARWSREEIDRLFDLKDNQNKSWEEVHAALGRHTSRSIRDKYWRENKKRQTSQNGSGQTS